MDIWVGGTSNQLTKRGSYTERKFSKKKMVTGKALFFVILPICHNIGLKCCGFNHSTFN